MTYSLTAGGASSLFDAVSFWTLPFLSSSSNFMQVTTICFLHSSAIGLHLFFQDVQSGKTPSARLLRPRPPCSWSVKSQAVRNRIPSSVSAAKLVQRQEDQETLRRVIEAMNHGAAPGPKDDVQGDRAGVLVARERNITESGPWCHPTG